MDRYLKFVSQKEPVLTATLLAAFGLALLDRFFGLSDGDLAILGPMAVVIGGAILRQLVYSPDSYFKALYSPPPEDEATLPD